MAFVQVIKFQTDRMEEGRQLVEEYRAATEGRRTTQRSISAAVVALSLIASVLAWCRG